jgi:hypothetical protein
VQAAVDFLLARQQPDGLWRDYALPPGASDAWTTSYVGLALAPFPRAAAAVALARNAVAALRRADGWGYNSTTASDADTTSFALRFAGGDRRVLRRFLDRDGCAHTFVGAQFGSWSWVHADVTAAVGLALANAQQVRAALLGMRGANGVWCSFWWTTDAYATARSLELLAATGGIPAHVIVDTRAWLVAAPPAESAFEAAQLLQAATFVGARRDGELVSFREADGGWPASPALLTPSQSDGTPGVPHADLNRLLTTASALTALDGAGRGSARHVL